jgi:uncharacterized membrane protein YbhN (UPF0104 family)
MKKSGKKLVVAIKLLITILCFALMFVFIGPARIADTFRQASIPFILIALCMTPVCLVVKIYRWFLLARSVDSSISFRQASSSYLAGLCLAVITPFATGELARGLYFQNRAELTGKVLIDKLVDLTVVALFTVVGIAFASGYLQVKIIAVLALIAMIVIWFLRPVVSAVCTRLSKSFHLAFLEKIGKAFMEIESTLLIKIFGLGLLFFALFYLQAFVLLNAFQSNPPLKAVVFFPLITLSTIIPVTIGGLGIREWAAAFLLAPLGISSAVAVSTFFTHFIVINFIPGLAGAPFVQHLAHKSSGSPDSKV